MKRLESIQNSKKTGFISHGLQSKGRIAQVAWLRSRHHLERVAHSASLIPGQLVTFPPCPGHLFKYSPARIWGKVIFPSLGLESEAQRISALLLNSCVALDRFHALFKSQFLDLWNGEIYLLFLMWNCGENQIQSCMWKCFVSCMALSKMSGC